MLRNYKELKVWGKSHQLFPEVYRISKGFPKNEIYGLLSQTRRAALSLPRTMAEWTPFIKTPERGGRGRVDTPGLEKILREQTEVSLREPDYRAARPPSLKPWLLESSDPFDQLIGRRTKDKRNSLDKIFCP